MSADLAQALDRLYALVPKGKELGLGRMQAACDKLGNPERAFAAVHVAGTNGKGTVSAFVASIARASGKRVGLYTSPHLVRFAERIQIDGAPWARTWWSLGGDSVTEFLPAAKSRLGSWDSRFDDDQAARMAKLPPAAEPCPTC